MQSAEEVMVDEMKQVLLRRGETGTAGGNVKW